MAIGDSGLLILAAQQLVEEGYRSDLASATIQHLDPVVSLVREISKKFNTATNKSHVHLVKVLFIKFCMQKFLNYKFTL
jgi:hypothetical protein